MTNRLSGSRIRRGAVALAASSIALAQEPAPKPTPFSERVEVIVRQVLVRITDPKGNPPSPPPSPEDIEVREGGVSAQVIGVDPVRSTPSPAELERITPVPQPRVEGPAVAVPAPVTAIPQHLYVDTTLLEPGSVTRLAAAFQKNLPSVLENGPLEIVVANPQPKQMLASTRDLEAVERALEDLSRGVGGKDSLRVIRLLTFDHLRNDLCPNYESTIRNAAEQELRIIEDSLDRLLRWATSLGGQRADVVYYAADGFDSDVTESYRRVIVSNARTVTPLCVTGDPNAVANRLQTEFSSRSVDLVGSAARSLSALGVQAMPLAFGGNLPDTGGDASARGSDVFATRGGTVPTFARPLEPLRVLAETTGGDVVTSFSQMPGVLDAFDTAYVVSFKPTRASDGKMQALSITSRRPGLSIRAPQTLGEGTPALVARGATVRALHEAPTESGIPLRIAIDGVRKSGKEASGVLHLDADLRSLLSSLAVLGGGRLRVTIAVDVEGAREPFTTSQEFDVAKDQGAFGSDIPITWPKRARKIAVTVEETRTGTRGTTAADVPPFP